MKEKKVLPSSKTTISGSRLPYSFPTAINLHSVLSGHKFQKLSFSIARILISEFLEKLSFVSFSQQLDSNKDVVIYSVENKNLQTQFLKSFLNKE
jgi:hypothetical protein